MKSTKFQIVAILSIIACSVIAIVVTVVLTLRNSSDLRDLLEESIISVLISTSIAARELLDVDMFYEYNSEQDILDDYDNHLRVLEELRSLKRQTGAEYIYALKLIDGTYYFIFDTDEEDTALFCEYEIFPVHELAFLGEDSAGVMNVVDDFGNFNTGAVPIWRHGEVIGIISTDIEDTFIQQSHAAANRNAIFLISALVLTLAVMILIVWLLLRNVRKMQDKLFKMANYDVLTGLPNRHYLMSYLAEHAERAISHNEPFAFMLIDLDNFKMVNDGSGHDAGDELLRHFSVYLSNLHEHFKPFHLPAGARIFSARIGGDEFVLIFHGIATEDEARIIAKKVLDNFNSQTVVDGLVDKYKVGLSIGVALFPFHTDNYKLLIKYADVAMYYAKKCGKNGYHVFCDEIMRAEIDKPSERSSDRRQFRR